MKKYNIFDSHAHYDEESFDEDREVLLKQLKTEGVIGIINCASSYESIQKVNSIINKHNYIYGALGIHPENANEYNENVQEEINTYIMNSKKVVAIGEIGLDYYWEENPPREVQKAVFRKQMEFADKLNLPVIIHDREAHQDTLEIIREFPRVRGVIHCFTGSVEFARECLREGYYIGITGVVTFKNAKKIIDVVKDIPINKLLGETDCPYMAPEPKRGKRNQSNYIEYIIEKIAQIKEIDSEIISENVNNNLRELFRISL